MSFAEKMADAKEILREGTLGALKFMMPKINPSCPAFDEMIQIEGRYHHIEKEFGRGIPDPGIR